MPPATLAAVEQSAGAPAPALDDVDGARRLFDALSDVGVDVDDVFETLETQGLAAFQTSFDLLLAEIDGRLAEAGA